MRFLLRALRYLLALILLPALVLLISGWWVFYRPLPPLDGTASLPELREPVTVDRDPWGVPHIRARSLEDLVTAQGYVVAQERLWQMDILRRTAGGELSEILGPRMLPPDRDNRTLGLRLAAEREARTMDPEARQILEAYARGVNRYIEQHRRKLPWEFTVLRYAPRRWTPTDTFLVAAYMYKVLTNTWRAELDRARVTDRVGEERARDLFMVDSPLDHFIVGGEEPKPTKGCAGRARASSQAGEPASRSNAAPGEPFAEEILEMFGSNNWVVDGRHTASGKPLLANDTHLPLDVPCIWYIVHLTAPGWNVKGFSLPGIPLVIIGHNDRIAWGFTNNGADVQDLYLETLNPQNPRAYRAGEKWMPAEARTERIRVRGQADDVLEVMRTRHGPIVHREAGRPYALRWTATEPGGLGFGLPLLGRARNWEEFRDVMRKVTGPAQNAVYADVDGNIGFLVAARIPIRQRGTGAVPAPGQTDDYEWTGYVPFDELPQVLNPPGGMIATANARVVGPAYRRHLTDRWASPHRTARIYELLSASPKLRPEECIRIQADVVSKPHLFLAQQLLVAAKSTAPQLPRTGEFIARLAAWDGSARATSVETTFLEFVRRALRRNLLRPYLGEDVRLYQWWREAVFVEWVFRERPARWLPKEFRSYDELLIASADEAVRQLEQVEMDGKRAGLDQWRWGAFLRLQVVHPVGRSGWRRRLFSLPALEQSGTGFTVKQTGASFGPAMRFVADLANFDHSLMNIVTGQSGQFLSPHYRDQFPAWLEGRGLPSAFTESAWEKARTHSLLLQPGTK